ncbi:MAG: hypothetical protein IJ926_03265 [Firmicutes bacterium]|nr:hypothetical protein [Bacillota bacterium]
MARIVPEIGNAKSVFSQKISGKWLYNRIELLNPFFAERRYAAFLPAVKCWVSLQLYEKEKIKNPFAISGVFPAAYSLRRRRRGRWIGEKHGSLS